MSASLRLTGFSISKDNFRKIAVYAGRHSTPGRDGTSLEFTVELEQVGRHEDPDWEATVSFNGCEAKNSREALQRLAEWLHRAAEAVDLSNNDEWAKSALPLGKGQR